MYDQKSSISALSSEIRSGLSDLKDNLERKSDSDEFPIQQDTIEDILDRFLLWAGNLGALLDSTNPRSLDSRLSASPEIYEQICEFLGDLREAIHDCRPEMISFSDNR
ncbi:hypothetical protein F4779DRAFT_364514 [Xylariaceae sp. FL0662B]|nr:hypothetical protein F4779DRAFT_364514 [Xylariaceae sp. FL0662B]